MPTPYKINCLVRSYFANRTTGASSVMAVGAIILFGSYFGCGPCGFIGGAIAAVGAVGYIACNVAAGNYE